MNGPMHIVFLSNEYPLWAPGGVGTFLQTFGRTLAAHDHRVTILGIGDKNEEEHILDQGVNLIRLPKNNTKLPNFWYNKRRLDAALNTIQKVHPIDIIESAELGQALISKKHKGKKVIRLHGGHHFFAEAENRGINRRKGILERRSFKRTDAFIAVSNYVKSHTAKYLSYHGKPIEIINYPINTSIEVPQVEVDPNQVLFAGTVCEKKGVRQLVQAFQMVREKYPEKVLNLFGRDWFYPDGSSYIEMLKREYSEALDQVIFHGPVSREELNIEYAQAAFCVFPSHMETQGLVSLEAMLLAKPVIFSAYGPGPETIEHGVTGLLCDVYNPQDIAEKMLWCIEHPDEAKKLGFTAQETVRKRYDKNTILEKNIAFYRSLSS